MNGVTALMRSIRAELAAGNAFAGVEILPVYAAGTLPKAPAAPRIAMEQGAVTVKGTASNGGFPAGRRKFARAAIRFHIASPLSAGAERCAELFSALCESLLFNPRYGVISLTAAPIRWRSESCAYELEATAVAETSVEPERGTGG